MQKALLLGLVCCALGARAQVFREGQLVRMSGDTLRGELEDNAWIEAPQQLRFRPEGGQTTTYPATDIRSFRVGGQYFRRETVPLDHKAQTDTNQLIEGLVSHQEAESLLAEVMVDGPAQLLFTSVGDVPHYFVQRPGQPFVELAARSYLRRSSEGTLVVADGNNFRAQLLQYFGDCPAAAQLLPVVRFSTPGLAAVVQAYNQQCSEAQQPGTAYLDRSLNQRVALNLGLTGGARFASARLHTDNAPGIEAPALQGVDLDGTVHPVGGAFAEVVSPGRRVALLMSGLLSSYGRTGSLPAVAVGYEGQLNSQYLLLETRIGARFFWPVGQHGLRLLGGTGITLPLYLSSRYNGLLRYGTDSFRRVSGYGTVPTVDEAPLSYPHGAFVNKLYTGLPYLEFGARQGRLTLLLDGRYSVAQDYYTTTALRDVNGNSGYNYSYGAWYAGFTLSYSLLHQL